MEEREQDRQAGGETRPQRAGEGATTRFGMEESGGAETPATGGPTAVGDEEEEARD